VRHTNRMKTILAVCVLAGASILTAASWTPLFDGATLKGWVNEGGANFRVENGVIRVDDGAYSWLRTEKEYGDFEMSVEFLTAADGNSGIFLRSQANSKAHETGYELQIYDAHPKFPTGSILNAGAVTGVKFKAGVWNRYQIRAQGKRIVVKLNGKQVLDLTDDKSSRGHLGLQFNPGKPISFRNVRVRELSAM
jgi:hypothetical protein